MWRLTVTTMVTATSGDSNKAHKLAAAEKSKVTVDVGPPGAAETLAWTLRLGG